MPGHAQHQLAPRLSDGTVFAGHFQITQTLGEGATGVVYAAVDLRTQQSIALKLLHEHLQSDPKLSRRFLREFRSGSALHHPNIVRVLSRDVTEQGAMYLVMELLRGRNLGVLLRDQARLPFSRIARILGQVLDAVGTAHQRGIIHRDLKPANVVLLEDGDDVAKVCDFGIAKLVRPDQDAPHEDTFSSLSVIGDVIGTPAYMSPEQARGERLDGRADLYAIAVMLYQMVTGELPFRAPTALGIVSRHLSEAPDPPSRRRPDLFIDVRLEALIQKGLAKRKEARPETAAEFRAALEDLARQAPDAIRPRSLEEIAFDPSPEPSSTLIVSAAASALSPESPESPKSPKSRTTALLAGLAVTLGIALWWGVGRKPPATSSSVTGRPFAAAPVAAPSSPASSLSPAAPPLVPPSVTSPALPEANKPSDQGRARPPRRPRPTPPVARPAPAQLAEAEALLQAGDAEGACAIVVRLRELPRPPASVYRLSGKCLMRRGRPDEAKQEYRRYLELAPDAPDAPFVKGILQR